MRSRLFALSFAVVVSCLPATAQAASQVAGDFNGDGHGDLAIGVPEENLAGAGNAGAVNVIYGSPTGLDAAGNQFWSQDSAGIEDAPESGDRFGHSLAAGDFNGDGHDDLAVGAQREDVGSVADAGAVSVIYGSAAGLTATGNQFWTQDSLDVEDVAEAGDYFGSALSAGQSGSGLGDDLAIGAPKDDVGVADAGVVNVLYGSATGLSAAGDQLWHEDTTGIEDSIQNTERFGSSVAWGNFNGDGNDDLAIAIPGEFTGSFRGGAAAVIYGSDAGLNATGDQHWDQDSPGIEDTAEGSDMVRSSLAVGDFDGDASDDLVLGFDGENIGSTSHTGAANVIYGSSTGLTAAGDQFWHQNLPGIEDSSEGGDNLAWALTAGDLDGDGDDDLALGARREDLGSVVNAGVVNVIPGSAAGLTDAGDVLISQASPGIEDDAEENDEFGSALFAGDLNGDGRDELGVGVILEDVGTVADAGVAHVLYDAFSSGGLNQLWHQDSVGIEDKVEDGDRLGYSFPG
ncbi:MAG: integrin alpha [Candidatus Limnocylindria bacterium]